MFDQIVQWFRSKGTSPSAEQSAVESRTVWQRLRGIKTLPPFQPEDYVYRLAEVAIKYFADHTSLSATSKVLREECAKTYEGTEPSIEKLAGFLGDHPGLQSRLSLLVNYTPSRWLVEREVSEIRARRKSGDRDDGVDAKSDPYRSMFESRTAGLCFSGGGIRSATFNLGMLQGMVEQKIEGIPILRKFDYLSTVSGGGYIHEWLAAWIKRENSYESVEHQLVPLPSEDCEPLQPPPITWLRRYSNYLTPEKGFFTADTWVVGAIWLRNTFLNQLVLISGLLLVVLLPHLLTLGGAAPRRTPFQVRCVTVPNQSTLPCNLINWASDVLRDRAFHHNPKATSAKDKHSNAPKRRLGNVISHNPIVLASTAILLFIGGVLTMAVSLRRARVYGRLGTVDERKKASAGGGQGIAQVIVICILLSGLCMTRLLFLHGVWENCAFAIPYCVYVLLFFANITISQAGGAREAFATLNAYDEEHSGFWRKVWMSLKGLWGLIFLLSGVAATGATALFLLLRWIVCCELTRLSAPLGLVSYGDDPWRLGLVVGPPLFLTVPFFSQVLLAGLIGRDFADWLREWLASVRAWSLMIGLLWGFWFGISLLTRPILLVAWEAHRPTRWTALISWLVTTGASVAAGKSSKTQGDTKESSPTDKAIDMIAIVGPYIFIFGLMVLLAWAADAALGVFNAGIWYALIYLLTLAVFVLFGWRVDINEFSMHAFYRNRLTRCYLGATNWLRRANPLTGFDERDTKDTILSNFRTKDYEGPFPIFCATLNLTFGEDLAWQQRKAASFIFTPLYSGYHVGWTTGKEKTGLSYNGYVPTRTFAYPNGGINMATAVAISGAAVSPNWGYHTNPATAFLLTMFNVRLGWWLRNPRTSKDAGRAYSDDQSYDPDELPAPRFPAIQLSRELIGSVSDSSKFVYLTDGGHFENMGLYELVRRRCRFIVVCDAEEDHSYTFEGIGNAIQRCRIDFGVEIDLNLLPLRPKMDEQLGYPICGRHFVSGTITYPDRWGMATSVVGKILYIKASLTGQKPLFETIVDLPGEPGDIVKQRLANARFPNNSTANQWFDEQTFESYRRLGTHVAEEISLCNGWTKLFS